MIFNWSQNANAMDSELNISLNGRIIERVNTFKFLGVLLDNKLSWGAHINLLSNKLSRTIGILSRLKKILPCNVLLLIYNSLFTSYINYAITSWGYGTIVRLSRLQKKAVRIITKSKYRSHSSPLFKKLKILKVEDTFKIASIRYYHKFVNNTLPEYFQNFPFNSITPRRVQRERILTLRYRDSQENLPTLNPIIDYVPTLKPQARRRLKHLIPQLVNKRYLPDEARDKIITHGYYGFMDYFKNYIINNYEDSCREINCFVCRKESEPIIDRTS